MQINPYLDFKGDCEAAFTFYERCFGGQLGTFFRYGGSPMADQVPDDWSGKIMHASVTLPGLELNGGDVAPGRYEEPKGFSLSVQLAGAEEAERVFHELADGGRILMPLEKTFWAERFGMVVDRFGVPWLINCGG
jgi:PhnB protein